MSFKMFPKDCRVWFSANAVRQRIPYIIIYRIPPISRSRHSMRLSISETVRDTDIVSME